MVDKKTFGATLWRYRKQLIIALPPLLFLPLPLLVPGQEALCAYIMIVMAVLWCTEAVPLSVTGMVPIFAMPMLGLLKSEDVAVQYMQESSLMFLGGLMVAIAFEKCNLHRRIALSVLVVMGVKPIWLMLGFMMPTWFLSMWISNTATTSMMIPILEAVLVKLGQSMGRKRSESQASRMANLQGHDNPAMENVEANADNVIVPSAPTMKGFEEDYTELQGPVIQATIEPINISEKSGNSFDIEISSIDSDQDASDMDDEDVTPQFTRLCKGMTLAVAYAANVGGTATLTGTTPNIVMKDYADDMWQEKLCTESPVNFASWMVYGAPTSFITVCIIWLWLAVFYLGPKGFKAGCGGKVQDDQEDEINKDIRQEFKDLGSMSYAEWIVAFIFVSMIMLWFFRSPGFVTGWGDILHPGYCKDSVVSFLCATALFCIPMTPFCWGSEKQKGKVETCLDWQIIHEKFPWGIIFLVGGGFVLAEATLASGLSDVIGEALTIFDVLPVWFMVTMLSLFAALLTEVTSNTATCTLIMPILQTMAEELDLNPLYLMFPCAVATSYAFMLPVSTPPNAIAFSYGRITVLDMVKTGIVLKLTVFVLTLGTETWAMSYFGFDEVPWTANTTCAGVTVASI